MDKDNEMKQDIPAFSCDVDVISVFTLYGAPQIFTVYR